MTQKKYWNLSNRILLFEAGLVWLFASFMLYHKGFVILSQILISWIFVVCVLGGCVFYLLMFGRISEKYIKRIHSLRENSRHILAFFNLKGYIMMALMISLGVILRKTGIIPIVPLAYFYIFMGTPLLISAIRFFIPQSNLKYLINKSFYRVHWVCI